ncbi:unnamed protein product [Moneuplotes crassus]|uniref:Uncharacterized protein n=1 Tax=Euplotes crassus TaxID=5936 RepID=A0AAD2D6I3_EUPCR|nr:unnamed protein product [Moneuplotes crassus]
MKNTACSVSRNCLFGSIPNSLSIYMWRHSNFFCIDDLCFVENEVVFLNRSQWNFLTFLRTDFKTMSFLLLSPAMNGFLPFLVVVESEWTEEGSLLLWVWSSSELLLLYEHKLVRLMLCDESRLCKDSTAVFCNPSLCYTSIGVRKSL